MPRRLSCSLTLDAVADRTKTVTRRRADSWVKLHVGHELILIEKGMGLAKGAKQVELARVRVTAVDVRPLLPMSDLEVLHEGLWEAAERHINERVSAGQWFADFWLASHGYQAGIDPRDVIVRRIEWVYLDG
jgi:hypothetical protein